MPERDRRSPAPPHCPIRPAAPRAQGAGDIRRITRHHGGPVGPHQEAKGLLKAKIPRLSVQAGDHRDRLGRLVIQHKTGAVQIARRIGRAGVRGAELRREDQVSNGEGGDSSAHEIDIPAAVLNQWHGPLVELNGPRCAAYSARPSRCNKMGRARPWSPMLGVTFARVGELCRSCAFAVTLWDPTAQQSFERQKEDIDPLRVMNGPIRALVVQ